MNVRQHAASIYQPVSTMQYRSSNCQKDVAQTTLDLVDATNEIRRKQLVRLLKERFDNNKAALARAIDRAPATVWRLVTKGEHQKPIGEKLAREIERALNLPLYWLDGVAQIMLPQMPVALRAELDVLPKTGRNLRAVPLLSEGVALKVFAGEAVAAVERVGIMFSSSNELGENAVGLTVLGAAMEPDYCEGDRVFVDPDVLPAPGDVVVAVLDDSKLILRKLRMLTPGGEEFELVAKQEDYAPVQSTTSNVRIAGVVVEHHRFRRAPTRRY